MLKYIWYVLYTCANIDHASSHEQSLSRLTKSTTVTFVRNTDGSVLCMNVIKQVAFVFEQEVFLKLKIILVAQYSSSNFIQISVL